MTNPIARSARVAWFRLLSVAGWFVVLAGPAGALELSLRIDDPAGSVGTPVVIDLAVDPSAGSLRGVGATLNYEPGDLEVRYVGPGFESLGGPEQATHLAHRQPGRVVFGATRIGGIPYQPVVAETIGRAYVVRRHAGPAVVTVRDAFVAGAGGGIQPVSLSQLVIGIGGEDSDGDGIADDWELRHFGNLDAAGPNTDYDEDGRTDREEFQSGTPPRIPYLSQDPSIGAATSSAVRLILSVATESNVAYAVDRAADLVNSDWQEAPFAITPSGPATNLVVIGDGTVRDIALPLTGGAYAAFRLRVDVLSDDADEDLIPDVWELAQFGNRITAGVGTDFDNDGTWDRDEYIAGTPPRIPYLTVWPVFNVPLAVTASGRLRVEFLTESNVVYRLDITPDPSLVPWGPSLFAVEPGGPAAVPTLLGNGQTRALEVIPGPVKSLHLRLRVDGL